jgi:hypothetical protein
MAGESTVRLVNKAAHVKNIGLGNGVVITVPPTEEGGAGVTVTFDNAAEREAFDKAVAQPSIKAWLDAGELYIEGGAAKSGAQSASGIGLNPNLTGPNFIGQNQGAQAPQSEPLPSQAPATTSKRGSKE